MLRLDVLAVFGEVVRRQRGRGLLQDESQLPIVPQVTYVEALAIFGLNPREKAFWAAGMKQMERLVDEFEALV